MIETAKLLASSTNNKTIVLTGAMIPYKFGSSDGLFNLGSALAFVQTLPRGVYIAMNGKFFDWNKVRKNKDLGEFEEIESDLI
jgi:L-asparaginase